MVPSQSNKYALKGPSGSFSLISTILSMAHSLMDSLKAVSLSVGFRSKLIYGVAAFVLASLSANAQQDATDKTPLGSAAQNAPDYLKHAGIDQNLNHPLPLADHFRDETGADVSLGSFFGKKPAMLALVY